MARQKKKPRQADPFRRVGLTLSRASQGATHHRTTGSFHRKGLAIVVAIAVISGVAAVAVAVSMTTLDAERISLFQGKAASSHFDITTHQLGFQGPVQVAITVKLTNTDAGPHTANVTAQVLDTDQNVISEETKSTGEIAGGDSTTLTFVFVKAGIANNYDSTFLVVRDQD